MGTTIRSHQEDLATGKCQECGVDLLTSGAAKLPCPGRPKLSVVTKIHDYPSLQDIPGQLERLAKEIREGKRKAVHGVLVLRDKDMHIAVFEHGETRGVHDTCGVLLHAYNLVSGHLPRGSGELEVEDHKK